MGVVPTFRGGRSPEGLPKMILFGGVRGGGGVGVRGLGDYVRGILKVGEWRDEDVSELG